ncbi:YD repeat-containing protein [Chitinophaga sp. YR573]|uniref:RHS repeat domain-containing protein n=1 Tax=Chitinophaga sp. YR573 TaxID=1881040 RepID=UPI0008CFB19F|nr:RHS repeat domain-containing protein [Chitinophaga sp. YR573]SEW42838.1 YD repeat-containing protein [Chitinophaga sp. YR573]
MTRILTLILFFCIVFNAEKASAQNTSTNIGDFNKLVEVLPPSPNASSLGKYGGINVGLNSGTANFEIPIFTYSSFNIQLPVSLTYSSNGVKTDEIASRAGTSWNLEAGGVITRTVYGGVDENVTRLAPPATYPARDQGMLTFLQGLSADLNHANFDAEPDVFNFNLNKYSGKFILDSANNIVLLNYSALKIEKDLNSGSALNWKITDPEGVQYYFGGDSARDQSHKLVWGNGCGKSFASGAVTAWYLSKIIHPNNDTLYLAYSRVGMTYNTGISQTMFAKSDDVPSCVTCGAIPNTTCVGSTTCNMAVLKEITSTGGAKIKFTYTDRKDVGDKLLSKVELFAPGASIALKTFELNYTYSYNTQFLNVYNNIDSSYRFRPFLSRLTERGENASGAKEYQFNYYNLNNIPPRLCYAQDHYGYFNGQNNTSLMPKPAQVSIQTKLPGATANRDVFPEFAKNGMLSKIIYPTGGEDSIEYGGNKVYKTYEVLPTPVSYSIGGLGKGRFSQVTYTSPNMPVQLGQEVKFEGYCSFNPDAGYEYDDTHHLTMIRVMNVTDSTNEYSIYAITLKPGEDVTKILNFVQGETYRVVVVTAGLPVSGFVDFSYMPGQRAYQQGNRNVGGMRVERLITKDPVAGNINIKKYSYVSVDNAAISSGGEIFEPSYEQYLEVKQPCTTVPGCSFASCFYYSIYSNSINNIYTYAQSPVSYSYVVESSGDNNQGGGTSHTYTLVADDPGNNVMGNNISSAPYTSHALQNGQELTTHQFRYESGIMYSVMRQTNHYKEDTRVNREIRAFVVNERHAQVCSHTPIVFEDFDGYDLQAYSYFPKWIYIDSTRILSYSNDGQSYNENIQAFTYGNKDHALLTSTASIASTGEAIRVDNYYASDLSYTGNDETVRQSLIAKHILSPLLEQKSFLANIQTHATRNQYQLFSNGLILPSANYLQIANYGVEKGDTFYRYDPRGRILERSKSNDVHEVFVWGYNNQYPVAKILGADYTTAISYVNQSVLQSPGSDQQLRDELQKIRTNLPAALVNTYTVKPLVGVTSETDATGKTTFYEYDMFGRLKIVRDKDGNILKQIDYRYKTPIAQ